jgi:outer membrane protein, multidrug efflux system
MRTLLLLTLTTSALAQVGPNYERPDTVSPPNFKGVTWRAASPAAHLPKGEWWKVFRDSRLNELETRATANNQELKAAMARFDQARATARVPSVNAPRGTCPAPSR